MDEIHTVSEPDKFILDIMDGSDSVISVKIYPIMACSLIDKFWENEGKHLRIRGFRQGAAKRDHIEKQSGGREKIYSAVFSIYANDVFVNHAPRKVILAIDHQICEGQDGWWMVRFKGWMEPKVQLNTAVNDIEKLQLAVPLVSIDTLVEQKMRSFSVLNPYLHHKVNDVGEPLPAESGDMVDIDVTSIIRGKKSNQTNESTSVRLIPDTIRPTELYEALLGKKEGDSFTLRQFKDVSVLLRDGNSKSVRLRIKVKHVYKCEESKIDDDMAITAGYNSLEHWRQHLVDSNTRTFETYKEQMKRTAILNFIMNNTTIADLPEQWQEIKMQELSKANNLGKLTADQLCLQINKIAKQTVALKSIGERLEIRWDDEDRPMFLRNDGNYAAKVLNHLAEKVTFEYVFGEPKKDGIRDRANDGGG